MLGQAGLRPAFLWAPFLFWIPFCYKLNSPSPLTDVDVASSGYRLCNAPMLPA